MSAELDQRMRQVLVEMEVLSAGTISSYSVVASGGAFGSQPPRSGDAYPPHVEWARTYNEANGDDQRAAVIEKAENALDAMRKTPPPKDPATLETPAQLRHRIVDDFEGVEAFMVALSTGARVSDVRSARKGAGREPDRGYRLETSTAAMSQEQRRERVAKHLTEGMTVRGIAMLLGVSPQTISNDHQAIKEGERRSAA